MTILRSHNFQRQRGRLFHVQFINMKININLKTMKKSLYVTNTSGRTKYTSSAFLYEHMCTQRERKQENARNVIDDHFIRHRWIVVGTEDSREEIALFLGISSVIGGRVEDKCKRTFRYFCSLPRRNMHILLKGTSAI